MNQLWQEFLEPEDVRNQGNNFLEDEENDNSSERSTQSREHSSDVLEILQKIDKPYLVEIDDLGQDEGSYSELSIEELREETKEEKQEELEIEKSLEPLSRSESQNLSEEDQELSQNEEGESTKEWLTKENPTARKGEFSENFYRDDKLSKASVRAINHALKIFFNKELKIYKKQTRIDLKKNSYQFYEWFCTWIEKFREYFLEEYNIELNYDVKLQIFSVVSYLVRVKTFKNFIQADFEGVQKRKILRENEKYRKFNDYKNGTSYDRIFALNHPAVTLGKIIIITENNLLESFWNKLLNRQGTTIPNVNKYKRKIAQKLRLQL